MKKRARHGAGFRDDLRPRHADEAVAAAFCDSGRPVALQDAV
ncbi:hypothetical protein ACGFR8_08405 [Streptomyces brevispora]